MFFYGQTDNILLQSKFMTPLRHSCDTSELKKKKKNISSLEKKKFKIQQAK